MTGILVPFSLMTGHCVFSSLRTLVWFGEFETLVYCPFIDLIHVQL